MKTLIDSSIKTPVKLIASTLLLSAALTGCDSAETTEKMTAAVSEKAVEKMGGSQADININSSEDQDSQNVTIEDGNGEFKLSVGGEVELPANFPDDVPLPDGLHYMAAAEVEGSGFSVHAAVPGNLQQMIDKTLADVEAVGWNKELVMDQGAGTTLMFKKADRNVMYTIGELAPSEIQKEGHNIIYIVMGG